MRHPRAGTRRACAAKRRDRAPPICGKQSRPRTAWVSISVDAGSMVFRAMISRIVSRREDLGQAQPGEPWAAVPMLAGNGTIWRRATRAILVSWRQASRSRLPTHSPHAVRGAPAVSLSRRMIQCYYGILSNSRLEAAVPAHVTEKQMRCRSTLALTAAFVGGSMVLAYAQAPAQAPVVIRGGGVAGTGIGVGAGAAGRHVPLIVG